LRGDYPVPPPAGQCRKCHELRIFDHGSLWVEHPIHRAWHQPIAGRRAGTLPRCPIADLLIGAFAANRRGLITRNPGDFRINFPHITLLEPRAAANR
jgi:predicted nucleic acid-binding protein